MIKAIIAGKPINEVLDLAGRLQASREELFEALQPEELSDAHLFVLTEIMAHIEELEARMGRFDSNSEYLYDTGKCRLIHILRASLSLFFLAEVCRIRITK